MQNLTIQEKTKVCALGLSYDLIEYLQQRFDVFEGSLGKRVKVKYEKCANECRFLPNYNLPTNLHEYEIFIEDMSCGNELEYCIQEHTHFHLENNKAYYFYCQSPQTVFNPICYGSHIIAESLGKHRNRPPIKIVFASCTENVQYTIRDASHLYDFNTEEKTNYEHLHFPLSDNICGTQTKLPDRNLASVIFKSFLNDIR